MGKCTWTNVTGMSFMYTNVDNCYMAKYYEGIYVSITNSTCYLDKCNLEKSDVQMLPAQMLCGQMLPKQMLPEQMLHG